MSKASDIRLIVSDVDGVWTDGKIIYAGETREVKEFNVRDGLGAKLAQRAGIQVALLTSRSSPALARRARELGIAELYQGAGNKLEACTQLLEKSGLRFDFRAVADRDHLHVRGIQVGSRCRQNILGF